MILNSDNPEETMAFGLRLATKLCKGSIVACTGNLGAGKTCLIQGICKGLGVLELPNSPTFVIANEYSGRLVDGTNTRVYHLDLFRVEKPSDLDNIGWEDYIFGNEVCLLEWADRVDHLLPEETIRVRIRVSGENTRNIEVSGASWEE